MEGTGNDYIYLDGSLRDVPVPDVSEIVRLSDRRTGVGGDGLVLIAPSTRAQARMRMWNADGSESGMCGNALRCVAMLTAERTGLREFLLETDSGLHEIRVLSLDGDEALVEVDMGPPRFGMHEIPFVPPATTSVAPIQATEPLINVPLEIPGQTNTLAATILSMGNPHCVLFVEDPDVAPVETLGPAMQQSNFFPESVNVEFVARQADGSFYQRTFERGTGETLSCGSGACAVLVASVLALQAPRRNTIRLRGGSLEIEWTGNDLTGTVLMRGPARRVFRGQL